MTESALPDPAHGASVFPAPDIKRTEDAVVDGIAVRSVAVTGLFVLAVFYTLHIGRVFFLPIVMALLLAFLLSPVVRALKRIHVPEFLGAALVMLLLLGVIGGATYQLVGPAQEWMSRAPASLSQVQGKLRKLRHPVEQVTKTAEQMARATAGPGDTRTPQVQIKGPGLGERLFGQTQDLVIGAVEMIILLFFLLASGDLFLHKLVKVLPVFGDKKRAVSIARETEAQISRYLLTVTIINVCLGAVVALTMALLGMPNPLLWGVLAGLFEFVPYLGASTMVVLLTMASLLTFDDPGRALSVPLVYFGINTLQGSIIAPLVLSRQLTLNPVAIFVGIVFWLWVWGIPGAFLAVPMIATFKIFCDHLEPLAPIGEFLGS
jgi:predicted PurR-regulated permease PerM